ncbi:gibberellin 20-oxidase [Penicillium subrubescens]|uniref:gibberellin 20-oxidase n=1 Tax=Penicillium subrubescens TaxID=1316194 RepID=UPI00254501EB|nr:gibberellin 20-oxidase [Penicillium subrubescens]KAJ5884031.1 gibberellin 20-oxidase [Penicillium subrubescens]
MTVTQLPLVDFGQFLHGNADQRQQAAKKLVDSFVNHGFVRLKNHGISRDFVQQIWEWDRAFFQLPDDVKMKIVHHPGSDLQRGWSRKGTETTSRLRKENAETSPKGKGELLDEKEHFDCGPRGDTEFPNKFPSEEDLPGFKAFIEQYFDLVQDVSLDIMRACEVGFKMPENSLVDRCIPAASELRLLHYPPVSLERLQTGTIKRAWPHTDFGIITLLFQDSLGGLEFEDRNKPFTFVPIIPSDDNELIVNTSQTFQRWTNGVVKAGLHQVNVPPHMSTITEGYIPERYSSVFFLKAHREISVGPIEQFVTEERPAIYPDITALQYQQEMTEILY